MERPTPRPWPQRRRPPHVQGKAMCQILRGPKHLAQGTEKSQPAHHYEISTLWELGSQETMEISHQPGLQDIRRNSDLSVVTLGAGGGWSTQGQASMPTPNSKPSSLAMQSPQKGTVHGPSARTS